MEIYYSKRCLNLACNLCNSNDTQIKQKIIEDGIEKNIEYCKKCFKDVQKNHLNKISSNSSKNMKIISSYGDKFVSEKAYDNITFDPYHERIVTELPLHVLKATFISDEYSMKRNEKNSIDRNIKYLELSLSKAQNFEDEHRIKRLRKLIDFFKSIK
jgi:recombinational DNA repair protein (RecF pathway)